MLQQFTNNAASTLAANIGPAALSLTVNTGDGALFPALTGGQFFLATLNKVSSGIEYAFEVVKVTARTGDVLTVVRAQEGTTALSFLSGDRVSLRVTAGSLAAFEAVENKDSTGGYAGLTLFKINFKNALNTFTSFFTNANTAARTYTFPDYDGTMATVAGTETHTNKTHTLPVINGYTEGTTVANSTTAYTFSLASSTVFLITLTGNVTYTFPTAAAGKSFTLYQLQDGTGSRTATWPGSVKWPAGTAPTITATASKADKFIFTCFDGTNWAGSLAGSNY